MKIPLLFSKKIVGIVILGLFFFLFFHVTKKTEKEQLTQLLFEWIGKEIIIPNSSVFTLYGRDTISHYSSKEAYKIILYVDSIGCTTCKLRLSEWKELKSQLDILSNNTIQYMFFIHAEGINKIKYTLKKEMLDIPICIDKDNNFFCLNNLPVDSRLYCFLLDKENNIQIIGNPVLNEQIKNMYIEYILSNTQ